MLTRLEKAQQKWGGSHSVIDKWLTEQIGRAHVSTKVGR